MTKTNLNQQPLKKVVYILRAVSGAGKSTLALELVGGKEWLVFEADKFHMVGGVYQWRAERVRECHEQCFKSFCDFVSQGIGPLVVSNTNTTPSEFQRYKDFAVSHGYTVFSLVVENRHGNKDVHNVPEDILKQQEERLRSGLRLR